MKYSVNPVAPSFPGTTLNGSGMTVNGTDPERLIIQEFRNELDGYYQMVASFAAVEPDQVLLMISSIGARLIYIRAQLQRSNSQRATRFRTTEIDPMLDHLDMQMRVHSRLISMRTLDWEMSGKGQP